eukprot:8063872-Prorocentrum_lima.AAC.1
MRERCWEWGLELAVGRLDIAAAFDGVRWEQLLQLIGQLLPPWIQHLLEQMYQQSQAYVAHGR